MMVKLAQKFHSRRRALEVAVGPFLALVLVGLMRLLEPTRFAIPNPPAFLLMAVVYASFAGGLVSGLLSAAIAWSYFAIHFSDPGTLLHYSPENLKRIIVWAFATPTIALMVGRLKARSNRAAALEEAARAQAELKERQQTLESVINNSPSILSLKDREGRYVLANPNFDTMLKLESKNLIGKTDFDIFPKEVAETLREHDRSVFTTHQRESFEEVIPTSDGEPRTFASHKFPINSADGTPKYVCNISLDITEQKRAAEALSRNQQQLSVAFQVLSDAVSIFDAQGNLILVNAAWAEINGYPDTDTSKMDLKYFASVYELRELDGSWVPVEQWPVCKVLRGEKISGWELKGRRRDTGQEWHFCFSGEAVFAPDGQVELAVVTNRDITEQKKAERELIESEARFKQLADSMTQLAWIARPDGHIYWYNKRWYKYTGMDLASMEGWGWKNVHHPDHVERVVNFVKDAWQKPEPWELTFPLRSATGEYRWFLTRAVPLMNSAGEITQWFGTNTDIHELRMAKEEAERANQLKSAFLANMSHEIRTPLGAMLGFADLLRDPGVSPAERANYIDVLTRNGENLSVIINDILDLSKVEAGHLTLEFTDVRPKEIAEDVLSLLRVKAKEKDLVLECNFSEDAPPTIVSDPVRMRQILLNLVGNAVKFTPFGSVKIHGFGARSDSGRNSICFEVSDTGIGVPEAQKENVFEMFVQADGSMTRRFGGTGLGLALSRRLARQMGGDIEITKTTEGVGTTFLVRIDDQPEKRTYSSEAARGPVKKIELKEKALEGVKVLVVDDSPDNQQLIWRYLKKQGAITESAENGLLGYRAALTGEFDIVLMDIQMPVMDGYTATQRLREHGFKKPIIALTAHVLSDVRQKCLKVGCTGHLPKPIDAKQLVAEIVELVKR